MILNNPFSLKGKTALITGGTSGLGYAIARCMIQVGANVIVIGRNAENAQAAAKSLGIQALAYTFDVAETNKTEQWVKQLLEKHQIDILVNNAGNHCKKPIEEMEIADFKSILDTHVVGAYALTRALVPHFKQKKSGNILFTASMASFIGLPNIMGYAAAKSAYLGMIHSLSAEIAQQGIRVNGIAPGWIDTPMLRQAIDNDVERKNKILGRTPMKKFGNPEDIGWAAVYLCSNAASFVTGHVLVVDGGALVGF